MEIFTARLTFGVEVVLFVFVIFFMKNRRGHVNDGATEMGFDRSDMIAYLRNQYAQEIAMESSRLKVLGWDEWYIEKAIDVYLNLRCESRVHASALVGVQVYLEGLQNGLTHEESFAEAMKVQSVAAPVVADDAATILNPQPEASVVVAADVVDTTTVPATLAVSASNFGVHTQDPSAPDATFAVSSDNFGVSSADSTLKVGDVRKRIATAMSFDPRDLEVSTHQPALVASPVGPVPVVAVPSQEKNEVQLSKKDIVAHMQACKMALIKDAKEKGGIDFSDDGAYFYGVLLAKGHVPAKAMEKVRFFCRQRQLGAEPGAASLAAIGTGPAIPEHNDQLDADVERALREQQARGLSRGWIAAIVIGSTLLVGGAAAAIYWRSTSSDQPAETQTAPNP